MNILITGSLSSLAKTFAQELIKQKHRVVLVSDDVDKLGFKSNNTIVHSINPAQDIFRDAMSSYGFDIVIFISTREEQLYEQAETNTGQQLDGLRNTLELGKHGNLKHFFYISSTEVYGEIADRSETTEPVPASINGQTLFTGEQYCKFYQSEYSLPVTILRIPYVYGFEEKTGLLYRAIRDCKNQNAIQLPGSTDTACSFLHVHDIADFLKRVIDEEYSSRTLVVNLSASTTITNLKFSEILAQHFPSTRFSFDEERRVFTGSATVSSAKIVFDWVDLHELSTELAKYPDLIGKTLGPKKGVLTPFFKKFPRSVELLKPVELILGAILTQFLTQLTGTLIQYKYVDFRLLFVVIMASLYGFRYGLLSAGLMGLSLIYTWYQLEIDWSLIIYNVGNWFPVVLYFVTGLIIGYHHDRTETIIHNEKKQTKLIYEKYQFLYEVFNEIRKLKEEFREQVIGYRDSFGKIYTITRELDTLQEQDVYFRAISILEELMENNAVAIYYLESNREYARLQVSSTALNATLGKSLKLSNYPEVLKCIEQGTIFQNTALEPNYPAYVAPVFNNSYPFNVPVAIIVIWSVKFESYSTYYYNLFKVISGLIQDSLLRAMKFLDANYEKVYIPATRILSPEAFSDVLKTRAEMNKNKIAVDQLIKIEKPGLAMQDLDAIVNSGIRAADFVGLGEDGSCYVLLLQADQCAAQEVILRFKKLGLYSKLLPSHEMLLDEWELAN